MPIKFDWKLGKADYISGTICDYTIGEKYYSINQTVTHVVLRYNRKDLEYVPNHNLKAIDILKRKAEEHYVEQEYIRILVETAKQSTCCKNKVGALLVRNDVIQGRAYNGAPVMLDDGDMLYQTTLHAEERVILKTPNASLCTLYTTLSPCTRCASIILESGIKTVKYLFEYSETYGIEYLKQNGVNIEQLWHKLNLKPFNLEKK